MHIDPASAEPGDDGRRYGRREPDHHYHHSELPEDLCQISHARTNFLMSISRKCVLYVLLTFFAGRSFQCQNCSASHPRPQCTSRCRAETKAPSGYPSRTSKFSEEDHFLRGPHVHREHLLRTPIHRRLSFLRAQLPQPPAPRHAVSFLFVLGSTLNRALR
jgi:hypothetical protein